MAFIYDLTDTWNNAAISFNGIKLNATDTASAAGSKLADLQINGASKFSVGKTGTVTATGLIESTTGGFKFPDGTTQTTASAGGTVTSVSGAGTVSGLTLTGTVTSSGSLTLGGTLSLTSGQVTTALGFTPYNATNPAGYITSSALSPYLTSATAATTYQPLDGDLTAIAALAGTVGLIRKTAANTYLLDTDTYLTGITSGQVTTALGYTPYNATNPSGYLSTVSLTSNVTGTLPIANGGTGATTAAGALTSLGAYPASNPNGYTANTGTVTGVTGAAPIVSSGGTAPVISIDAATTSLPGSMSAADKTKLDGIATNANNYVLPKATATALGGVEVFDATVQTVAANAVSSTAARTYGVQLNAADQMVVNVPWTDTASGGTVTSVNLTAGTGVSVSGGPITSSGSITVTNTAPDQVVSITAGSNVVVTGTYPDFTVAVPGGGGGGGNVSSVDASGGTTGLTFSGGPITSAGTLTLAGTLDLDNGGTGATTASGARTNLGLGTAATTDASAYATAAQGTKADTAVQTIASADGSVTITGTTAIDLSVPVTAATNSVLLPVRNTTGATLTKGTAVYISGATGQISTVSKALATSDATSAQTLGLITANLANNSNGNVTLIGAITNIDTSAYTDGQQLYLSPTTAGTLTATKPYAPQHLVYMAVVEHAHPSQGKLFVKVQNGYEMDELHNVAAQSPANNDGLFYNTTTSLWEKKSIVTALGYTPYNATNPSGYITSSALTPYLTSATAATTYQPLDGDLTAIAAISGTTGIVRKTAADTYTLDTNTYLTGITSGQVTTALGFTPYDATNPAGYTTNTGTVTSVGGTGTVNGITLTGTVTASGSLTLGGTLSGVDLTTQVTGTLPVANGGTGAATLAANNVLLGNGTSALQAVAPGTAGNVLTSNGTTWTSSAPAGGGGAVSYPQNIQSANYTLVLGDAGKQIFHPASDANFRTYTIPANASVAFPIGTVVLFTVENSGVSVNVAITSDTLVFGNGTTGAIRVGSNNTLMCLKVTATKWMANYLYQTGSAYLAQSVAIGCFTTPFLNVYDWSNAGFGVKYTDPATLPAGSVRGVTFNAASNAIALAHGTSPFITAYPWSLSGFGTKFANPATLPTGTGYSVAFSPASDAIAVAHDISPFVTAYPWSGSGFGTKFANPATLPTGTGQGVAFSPSGNAIAVAHATSPFITAYPWSGSGFGTKFTNPATLPTGIGGGVAFSPAGDAIAVAHDASPLISVYPWSGSGFGTKFANPATLPTDTGNSVAFSPSGNAIAVAHATSRFITAYPWSAAGFGVKYTDPATLPTGTGRGVAFSATGDAIAVAHSTTPFITAYPWSASGFGTKYSNPATLPPAAGFSVAFTINP